MRQLIALAAAMTALAGAGTALAGGWATVGLGSLPTGLDAGEPWLAEITLRQHGRTLTNYGKPTVTIRNTKTGEQRVFPAKLTRQTGVFAARVVFPSPGTWRYEIASGWGGPPQTYAPVTIGGGGGGVGLPVWPIALGSTFLAIAGCAALALRRREAVPAPSH